MITYIQLKCVLFDKIYYYLALLNGKSYCAYSIHSTYWSIGNEWNFQIYLLQQNFHKGKSSLGTVIKILN
jgi:hypothetical protein